MTTSNLIGYDPLAWMDGAELEEEIAPRVEPVKKTTRSKAKEKAIVVEVATENSVVLAHEAETQDTLEKRESEEDSLEIDVTLDAKGDLEITVETHHDTDVSVDVLIETLEESVEAEVIDSVSEVITEDIESQPIEKLAIAKTTVKEQEEELTMTEEIAHVEEAAIGVPVEPHIDLAAESTIKTVAMLYDTLKHALDVHDVIEINGADVTTIDTATLQLLVSLKKDAPNLSKTVDIIYPSARFIESAKLLGLLDILGLSAH